MEPTPDEINELKAELKDRKGKRKQLQASDPMYVRRDLAYTEEIIEKERRLNIYLMSQRGKFASPISLVLSYSYNVSLPNLSTRTNHGHMNTISQSKNGVNNGLLVSNQFLEYLHSTVLYDSDNLIPTGQTVYYFVCLLICVVIVVLSTLEYKSNGIEWPVALGSTVVVVGTILLHKSQGTILNALITCLLCMGGNDDDGENEEGEGFLNGYG